MIDPIEKKPQYKKRLSLEKDLNPRNRNEIIPADITVTSYKTLMSLHTETRIQIGCSGEPLIELYEDEKGYLNIEIQGLTSHTVRVKLSAMDDQKVQTYEGIASTTDFFIE